MTVAPTPAQSYRPILEAFKSLADGDEDTKKDIEDVGRRCKNTGRCCSVSCGSKEKLPVHMVLGDAQLLKPQNLDDLFNQMDQYPGEKIMLVLGGTATGLFSEFAPENYTVLIDINGINELQEVSVGSSYITIGAALTLSELMIVCKENASGSGFSYLQTFADFLKKVANVPIRNLGTWSGNLMIKHKFREFSSDIFSFLVAVGATIIIGGPNKYPRMYSLMEFLNLNMDRLVILSVSMPSMNRDTHIRAYRIAPRQQNAPAIMTAVFRIELDEDDNDDDDFEIKSSSLVYGGVSGAFVHAVNTESFLKGKRFDQDDTLQGGEKSPRRFNDVTKGALERLDLEVQPAANPVKGSVEYRKGLSLSLFYKFFLNVLGNSVDSRYRSGGKELERPLSSATQTYDTTEAEWPLTESIPQLSAKLFVQTNVFNRRLTSKCYNELTKTSGEAKYVYDTEASKRQLYGAFFLSTEGNARFESTGIDTSEALASPGVVKILTYSDIPGENNFIPQGEPEQVFCSGKVLYEGQAIGLVVADTQHNAEIAARKVNVTYTDIKKPIITFDDAIAKESFFDLNIQPLVVGNAEAAISSSQHKIEGSIQCGNQYHFKMEPQVCVCTPSDGIMHVLASTQGTDATQAGISQVLNIDYNKVSVKVTRLGGSFGSCISRNNLLSTACALAAFILNKPVRVATNLKDEMRMLGGRVPHRGDYKVGFTNEGKLNGVRIKYYSDCGASPNESTLVTVKNFADNAYNCPAWKLEQIAVKTNTPSTTFCRGPGSTPGVFFTETIMEHIAKILKMDPEEVKKKNLYVKDQLSLLQLPLTDCNIRGLMDDLTASASVQQRKLTIQSFNQANRWKKKGLSVVPLKFPVKWSPFKFNCFVTIFYGDGSVEATVSGIESGQGINTKVAQVIAYKLGIPLSLVTVAPTNPLTGTNSSYTAASITTELCVKGIIECCNKLNAIIEPVRQALENPTWLDVIKKCSQEAKDLTARYWHVPEKSIAYHSYGVTATEVELDVLTGQHLITRLDVLYDCGKSMNPLINIGQIEGAMLMGLGYFLNEKFAFDPNTGKNLTNGALTYFIPSSGDMPREFNVHLLQGTPNPDGILGSKACAEPPLNMSCSAVFALKHAIEAARKEIDQDVYFPLDGPATPEVLHSKCLVETSQFVIPSGYRTKSRNGSKKRF